jgi:hypothetical protein
MQCQCNREIIVLEVKLCQEEMAPDLPGGVVRVLEEVVAGVGGVLAG